VSGPFLGLFDEVETVLQCLIRLVENRKRLCFLSIL
jgi:hypothetical protein